MDILYTLIPLSVFLIFGILVVLAWAVNSGQFEDLDAEAERILLDDFAPPAGTGDSADDAAQAARRADRQAVSDDAAAPAPRQPAP
ncbi:MAG: cbb3-type cytochrome oxidase assembly protein CcoS [Lautropia sp.]|nr:cbb3-type cytochrome oxidase assembly protein CcoS [Lautropia sp.]